MKELSKELAKLRKENEQLKHLSRFMCETWAAIDKWAYANMTADQLGQYPVIQGTSNQINRSRVGQQKYDNSEIMPAVKAMLEERTVKGEG